MTHEVTVGARDLVLRDRGRVLARESFGVEDGSLQAALRRLLPARSSAVVTASVAAGHTRMLLLPWLPQLTRPERWLSLAASRFEQTFGEPPDGWALRVAEDLPPRARVAAAIPVSLLRALQSVARLRSVTVALLDALGALLQREPAFSGCVAQIGSDSASLLMLWRGELRRIRMRRFDTLDELAVAAHSEWIAAHGGDSKTAAAGAAVAVLAEGSDASACLASAIESRRVIELS